MKLTKDDVWGNHEENHKGMIVADCRHGGFDKNHLRSKKKCPIFNDFIDWKSVTVICDENIENEVSYWLAYVHGGGNISKVIQLPNKKIAMRSDYQCW